MSHVNRKRKMDGDDKKMPSSTRSNCFIEIHCQKEEGNLPEWIECYVIENINPQSCGPIARDLNAILPLRMPTPTPSSASADASTTDHKSVDKEPTLSVISGNNFPNTDHLKRIRRRPATANEIQAKSLKEDIEITNTNTNDASSQNNDEACKNPKKRTKKERKKNKQSNSTPCSLDILVGSVTAVDYYNIHHLKEKISLSTILERYNLSTKSPNFKRKSLPGRSARTKEELDQWNKLVWPTLFYEEKTVQYKEERLALTDEEVEMMKRGMKEALDDAMMGQKQWKQWASSTVGGKLQHASSPVFGVVVIDPQNGCVVSKASDERLLQAESENAEGNLAKPVEQIDSQLPLKWKSFPEDANPLCTAVLLAIQGVSRRERQIALGCGMESEEFRKGQVSISQLDIRYPCYVFISYCCIY